MKPVKIILKKIYSIYIFIYILSFVFCLSFGSVSIDMTNIMHSGIDQSILFLRLQNFIQASLVGAALALSGSILQKLFKNPLADPFILGISSGGTCFSALFVILSGIVSVDIKNAHYFDFPWQFIMSLVGCLFAFFLLFLASKRLKNSNSEYSLPVIGIILNTFFASILMFIIAIANAAELSQIQVWLIGNLQSVSHIQLGILIFVVIILSSFVIKKSAKLNYMLYSDDFAKSLGVDPEKLRQFFILCVSGLVAVAVSISGSIAFVGLIVPHIIRSLHRLPALHECILNLVFGSIVLVIAQTFSMWIVSPAQLPVGVFTALFGAPALALILLKKGGRLSK